MSTKVLTGTYVSGYLLQSPITTLRITATAYIEGPGVTTPAGATQSYSIFNAGRVVDAGAGSAGINLTHGGTVTNGSAGYIFGGYGVSIHNAPGRVANSGSIVGSGAAVYLAAGGRVTNGNANDTGALIESLAGTGVRTNNQSAVTDGTHPAHITLTGDYLGATFVAGGDGDDGTIATVEPRSHWLNPISGSFTNASDWSGGMVPGAGAVAILDASGSTAYTVTSSANTTVGAVQTAANATLAISAGVLAATAGSGTGGNFGTISVADGATFSVSGTVDNAGVLAMQGMSLTGPYPNLQIGSAGLTLTGGGEVMLADSLSAPFQPCPPKYSLDRIIGVAGATLTNVDNTIAGAGWIGLGQLTLVNEARGVIDASLVTDLLIDTTGTSVNSGTLEATGAGGLYIIYSTVDNHSGGVISANGGIVYLSFSDIIGGTLTSSGSGFIYLDHGAIILDGSTAGPLINKAYVSCKDGATLTIDGAIDNMNEIEIATGGLSTSLIVGAGGASLTGGGKIVLGSTNPLTRIVGATAGATLINVDNTLSGQGEIGAGSLILINEVGGVIDGPTNASLTLTLDTRANTITNAGLIEVTGRGGMIIASAVDNSGILKASGGSLTVNGTVSGSGEGVISGGRLDFTAAFSQAVVFSGTTGVLELAQSQSYTGAISGFSKTGGTSLDLADIGFVSADEATFSGTATSGVLTVTDGTNTARITLVGDYRASTFTASSDGHGGTVVVDPAAAHRFIAAAASLGGGAPGSTGLADAARQSRPPMLARPGVAIA